MGIQSTMHISRKKAIDRIIFISNLVYNKKYRDLEDSILEDLPLNECILDVKTTLIDFNLSSVNNLTEDTLNDYSNSMLQGILDRRCFRHSYFDNYIVV